MVIFIDDRPIRILKKSKAKSLQHDEDFDLIVDTRLQTIKVEKFTGHTCLINVSTAQIEKIIISSSSQKHQFMLFYPTFFTLFCQVVLLTCSRIFNSKPY